MLPIVILVAGLILLFAGSAWFAGAGTVGLILTIAGVALLLVQLVWVAFVAHLASRKF